MNTIALDASNLTCSTASFCTFTTDTVTVINPMGHTVFMNSFTDREVVNAPSGLRSLFISQTLYPTLRFLGGDVYSTPDVMGNHILPGRAEVEGIGVSTVPEPGTLEWLFLGNGVIGLAEMRRKLKLAT